MLVAGSLLVGAGGCGSAALPKGAVVVVLRHVMFNPSTVVVDPGTLVVWKWDDPGVPHDVTSEPSGPLRSRVQTSGTYRYQFTTPGTYHYVCTIHVQDGMIGTVVVR